jgi:restriction endonuclease S subunit
MNCYENKGGHTYQRIGKGVKNDPNCDNMSHHNNDTKKALEAIGYWILNVASSDKLVWQKKVLAQLVPILCTINQENLTLHLNYHLPSLFHQYQYLLYL